MSCPETSGCYVVQGGGKKREETETVRSLFLAGDMQVWRLKAAAVAAAAEVEGYSVLGGGRPEACLTSICLPSRQYAISSTGRSCGFLTLPTQEERAT